MTKDSGRRLRNVTLYLMSHGACLRLGCSSAQSCMRSCWYEKLRSSFEIGDCCLIPHLKRSKQEISRIMIPQSCLIGTGVVRNELSVDRVCTAHHTLVL